MPETKNDISIRKKEHLDLCLTDSVGFKTKSNGFENYDFIHNALTEVEIEKINFQTNFYGKKISYPFMISCMTGGTTEAENINKRLAEVAEHLNIPIGVGSQRQALTNSEHIQSYKVIRQKAKSVPVLGNIGAAQVAKLKNPEDVQRLVDMLHADAMVIHLNPLQELLQKEGEPYFKGLTKKIKSLTKNLSVPVIVKEVGSGISYDVAKKLLESGVKGIDVAGAGGTSWAGVEVLRNKNEDSPFWDWGLQTSFCIRKISKLQKNFDFVLIGSGGINSSFDAAKALALGADLTASARIILQTLMNNGQEAVVSLIINWFEDVRKIMFLTGSKTLRELKNKKLLLKDKLR